MFNQIMLGLVIALSYFAGVLLYFGTRDELDPLANKLKLFKRAKLFLAAFYGIILGLSIKYGFFEYASLILFAWIIAESSFSSIRMKRIDAIKQAGKQAIVFFIFFIIMSYLNFKI